MAQFSKWQVEKIRHRLPNAQRDQYLYQSLRLYKRLCQIFVLRHLKMRDFLLKYLTLLCSRFAYIYHLSKDTPLRRTDTILSGLGAETGPSAPPLAPAANQNAASEPWTNQRPSMDEPDLTRQASDLKIKSTNFK